MSRLKTILEELQNKSNDSWSRLAMLSPKKLDAELVEAVNKALQAISTEIEKCIPHKVDVDDWQYSAPVTNGYNKAISDFAINLKELIGK